MINPNVGYYTRALSNPLGLLSIGTDDYKIMHEAGCRWIFFGVESGNDEMLKRIHKNIDKSAIKPTWKL